MNSDVNFHSTVNLAGFKETSSVVTIDRALTFCNVVKSEKSIFIDIGCGDGIVLEHVANTVGCDCIGIEYDTILAEKASKRLRQYTNIQIYCNTFENFDFTSLCQYDHIYIYLFLSFFGNSKVRTKIIKELPIGSKVITLVNPMGGCWTPEAAWIGNGTDCTLYLHILTEDIKIKEDSYIDRYFHPQWIHPPPGSYCPIPIPPNVKCIPYECTEMDLKEVSKEDCVRWLPKYILKNSLKNSVQNENNISSFTSSPIMNHNFLHQSSLSVHIDDSNTASATNCPEEIIRSKNIPPAPPLPPWMITNQRR